MNAYLVIKSSGALSIREASSQDDLNISDDVVAVLPLEFVENIIDKYHKQGSWIVSKEPGKSI